MDRALRVLEAFLGEDNQIGVLELSRQLALDKSVTHRILSTLVARRFLEQDPVSRRYRVGLRIWELGQRYLAGQMLKDVAEKELTRMIAGHPYATAYLAQLDGGDVVVVSTIRGPGPINLYMDPGSRLIAEQTTTGRTLLAFLPPVKADQVVARRRQARGSVRPFAPLDELKAELAAIRSREYGESEGRYTPGVNTVAVALCDRDGAPVLSLSVDYLTAPETAGLAEILPRQLQDCVRRIERMIQASGGEAET
ncbi:IclR family transcriptional regulator [Dactylosporangium sp. CA-092794]|uniref:IclR family transcriptional regulator n=1 Tax=Dactylosporangium sp. CA-092794 TaxID=3239929 RepID=UPI003D94DD7B